MCIYLFKLVYILNLHLTCLHENREVMLHVKLTINISLFLCIIFFLRFFGARESSAEVRIIPTGCTHVREPASIIVSTVLRSI